MKLINQYDLFKIMLEEMGETGWWPAESRTEIVVGAILIQNTNWINADRALNQLKEATQLDQAKLLSLTEDTLQDLVRPAGFYKNKSKAIHSVLTWFDSHNNNLEGIKARYQGDLRKELLRLHGVGEETADVFLLYIFDLPVFVSDKYAQKLYTKLGIPGMDNYKAMRRLISLDPQFTIWEAQEFHGLIDEFGKLYLRGKGRFEESFLAGYRLDASEFE